MSSGLDARYNLFILISNFTQVYNCKDPMRATARLSLLLCALIAQMTISVADLKSDLLQELNAWIEDDITTYQDCDLDITRCIGIPPGCLDLRNCKAFVEIQQPAIGSNEVDYKFKMILRLGIENYGLDTNHWVGFGLNKEKPGMASASVVVCYFGAYRGLNQDGFLYGWNYERNGVLKVLNNKDEEIKHFVSMRDETKEGETILKCGFYRNITTTLKLNFAETPGLKGREDTTDARLTYDLARHSFYLLAAHGTVAVNANNEITILPHRPVDTAADESRTKLPFVRCGVGTLCIGKGEDGCATVSENCDLYLRISNQNGILLVELESRVQNGYVALGISNADNIADSNSKIFKLLSCDTRDQPVHITNVEKCINMKSSNGQNILRCEKQKESTEVRNGLALSNINHDDIDGNVDKIKAVIAKMTPDSTVVPDPVGEDSFLALLNEFSARFPEFGKPVPPDARDADSPPVDVSLFCAIPIPPGLLTTQPYFIYIFSGNDSSYGGDEKRIDLTFTASAVLKSRSAVSLYDGTIADFVISHIKKKEIQSRGVVGKSGEIDPEARKRTRRNEGRNIWANAYLSLLLGVCSLYFYLYLI